MDNHMKAKYIFASLAATLTMIVGCQKEETIHFLDEVKVSSSYVSIPQDGGSSAPITVDASSSWTISGAPAWLTSFFRLGRFQQCDILRRKDP